MAWEHGSSTKTTGYILIHITILKPNSFWGSVLMWGFKKCMWGFKKCWANTEMSCVLRRFEFPHRSYMIPLPIRLLSQINSPTPSCLSSILALPFTSAGIFTSCLPLQVLRPKLLKDFTSLPFHSLQFFHTNIPCRAQILKLFINHLSCETLK